MSKNNSLTGADGEGADLGDAFFAKAKRGRPAMLPEDRKVRMNFMIDPNLAAQLEGQPNKSALVNEALRKTLSHA